MKPPPRGLALRPSAALSALLAEFARLDGFPQDQVMVPLSPRLEAIDLRHANRLIVWFSGCACCSSCYSAYPFLA